MDPLELSRASPHDMLPIPSAMFRPTLEDDPLRGPATHPSREEQILNAIQNLSSRLDDFSVRIEDHHEAISHL